MESIHVSHLPPLSLFITLPSTYPSESAPNFTLVSSWLSKTALVKLCKKLDQLWEENKGLEILFTWMAFLKDETLEFLRIETGLAIDGLYTYYKMALEKNESLENREFKEGESDIDGDSKSKDIGNSIGTSSTAARKAAPHERQPANKHSRKPRPRKILDQRAVTDFSIGRNPVQMLVDYDSKRKEIEFKRNFYTCKICFLDKLGDHCTQFLPCFHIFCKECILAYLEIRIRDGNVKNIGCPEDKCSSEASPGQVCFKSYFINSFMQ